MHIINVVAIPPSVQIHGTLTQVPNTSHQRRKDVTSSIFEPDMRRIYYVEIPFSRYDDTFIQRLRRGRFQRPGDVNFDLKSTSNRRLQ